MVRELLCALAARPDDGRRYLLYAREPWMPDGALDTPSAADSAAPPTGTQQILDERFQWRPIDARDPWWHVRAARAANRECDVFLSSNSYLTSRFLRIPGVPIVYDLTTFEPGMHPNRRSRVIERLTLGAAVRRSAALLSISQATAEALVSRFPAAASRTVVGHLGVATGLTPGLAPDEAARLPAPGFVLAVGTLEPRKNLPRLVAAYAAMDPALQAEHPLVVVGALGWDTTGTLDALRSLGERCTRLGYVSDAALAECYRRCAVFCYPSLGEGFGLPVLEAMAAGATVLTSNVSSLPEVGGEAVAYADPTQIADISAQLQELLRSGQRRTELSARARARAEEFSWARFAQVTLDTLERAARSTRA